MPGLLSSRPVRKCALSSDSYVPRKTLPVELCEHIIGYIAEDPGPWDFVWPTAHTVKNLRTLQACSLTCTVWAAITRRFLFSSLGVRCERTFDRNLDALFARVSERQPPRSHVSWLTVEAGPEEDPGLHTFPLRTPHFIPSLQYLRMRSGVLYTPPSRIFEVSMKQFKSVLSLTLSNITLHSVHDLRRMVCALRNLEALIIYKINWRKVDGKVFLPSAYPPAPKSIQLRFLFLGGDASWQNDSRSTYLVTWLGRSGVTRSVQTLSFLHLMACNQAILTAMQSVIKAAQATVKALILGWAPGIDPDSTGLSETISSCTILRSLQIVLPYHAPVLTTLAPLLSHTTPSSTTRKVELWFLRARACALPPGTHFRALDDVLQQPQWAKLVKLEVQHYGVHEGDDDGAAAFAWGDVPTWVPCDADEVEKLREELKVHMPLTHARGILSLSRSPKPDKFAPV